MKYAMRILSLVLAATATLSMSACGRNIYDDLTRTANYGTTANVNGEVATNSNNNVTVEDNSDIVNNETDNKDNNSTTKNGDTSTTENKSTSTTTRPTTTRPTTTKRKTLDSVPSGVSAIINAYNNAANKTKAQNNMTVDKTCDVEIVIDDLAGEDWITSLANRVASSFMKNYSGQTVREVYVNGKPTRDTTTKDIKHPEKLARDKNLFIPIMNKSYMSRLSPSGVVSATATKTSDYTYKVVIKLRAESTDLNTPPAITSTGMDYFDQDVFDLQGFRFESGTANYKNCVITATINSEGYVEFVEHKMSVSSTDATVSIIGIDLDGKIHGDYVTTFKFS